MFITAKSRSFVVLDELLSIEDYQMLQAHLKQESYSPVHSKKRRPVWRPLDGDPLIGNSFLEASRNYEFKHSGGHPFDGVVKTIYQNIDAFSNIIGVQWSHIVARAYLYQMGSALSWHRDSQHYSGAFAFYCHTTWKSTWGGELLVSENARKAMTSNNNTDLDARHSKFTGEDEHVESLGIGVFILPKPNRLVVISPEAYHSIRRVDIAAGENMRCSIAGFFVRKEFT